MTNGLLLNNQLTDFNAAPSVNGVLVTNRLRSSMAPTLVFNQNADGSPGEFVMATGSPGGATIIQYVTKTLVSALDWKLNAQQSVSMIDFGSNNATTIVGGEHPNIDTSVPIGGVAGDKDPLVAGQRALGHVVSVTAQSSGLSAFIKKVTNGVTTLGSGADPRREGVVFGDTYQL